MRTGLKVCCFSGDTNFGGEVLVKKLENAQNSRRRILWNQLHPESVSEDTNNERTSETAGTSSEFTPRFDVCLHDARAR